MLVKYFMVVAPFRCHTVVSMLYFLRDLFIPQKVVDCCFWYVGQRYLFFGTFGFIRFRICFRQVDIYPRVIRRFPTVFYFVAGRGLSCRVGHLLYGWGGFPPRLG